MPQPVRERRPLTESTWFRFAVLVWLGVYFAAFFSQDLPNSTPRVSRETVARETPWLLLDLVDPPRPDAADPQAVTISERSGWRFFPQRFDLLFVASFIVAGAWGCGHLALRVVRPPLPMDAITRNVFALGLGLSAVSLATLGCGLIGWLSRSVLGALLLVGIAAELILRIRTRTDSPLSTNHRPPSTVHGEGVRQLVCDWWWLAASAPFLLCILLGAMLPSTDFDANEYHLQGPKEYFQNGCIEFLPHNVYTSFPFGTEMLTLLAMVLRGDWYRGALAGKTVLACFAPLTAFALFAAGRKWFGSLAGGFAAFIYLSTPWVYRFSTIAGAEGGLCCFLFLALFAALLAVEKSSAVDGGSWIVDRGSSGRMWLLVGLFSGSAMACKYPGVLSVVIPIAIVAAVASFRFARGVPDSSGWHRPLLWFAIGTAITIGPWLAKNAVETGNPVYPLMYRMFGGRDWDNESNVKWKHGHSPDNHAPADLVNKFVDVTTRSDWLSPLLFGLAPLALIRRDTRFRTGWLWIYVGYLFLTWWVFTHRIDRFWVPLIPVVSLLSGAGAAWLMKSPLSPGGGEGSGVRGERLWTVLEFSPRTWLIGTTITAISLFNLAFITTPLCNLNVFLLDLNHARSMAARITAPEIAYLNEHLPPGSKVLCVGEAPVFDAEFPLIYETVFDRSIFEEWCRSKALGRPLRDTNVIRQRLRDAGVTHVMVNWSEIVRYRATYGYTNFVLPAQFVDLQQAGVLGQPWVIPLAYRDVTALNYGEKQVLGFGQTTPESWIVGGRVVMPTFQVFPVAK
jgi:hypothetical protein